MTVRKGGEQSLQGTVSSYLIPLREPFDPSAPTVELNPNTPIDQCMEDLMRIGKEGVVIHNGTPMGRIDAMRVYTDYIQNHVQRNQLISRAFDEIQEGVCICDAHGIVQVWNRAIQELYEIPEEEILGRHLEEFFSDAADLRVLKTGERLKNQKHTPRSGTEILISAAPIYANDKLIGAVSTDKRIQDIMNISRKLNDAMKFIRVLEEKIDNTEASSDFYIGNNADINRQVQIAARAASTDVPILITGETGTGKEVFARYIHKRSKQEGAFVAVNCSAIPEHLFESEFFGYVKGAFTGADQQGRVGYFEQANGGTLFLDEVGELPLAQQTKLLRTIQDAKVRPLGADHEIPVQVRLISATNADLEAEVANKTFRIDLYYRLRGINIELPPLRDRNEDIESILQHFLALAAENYNPHVTRISHEAMQVLKCYLWPGNVRELKNVLRQMVVLAQGDELTLSDIPQEVRRAVLGDSAEEHAERGLKELVEQFEYDTIDRALHQANGNIARAAVILKIPRTTLQYKIQKLGLEEGNMQEHDENSATIP